VAKVECSGKRPWVLRKIWGFWNLFLYKIVLKIPKIPYSWATTWGASWNFTSGLDWDKLGQVGLVGLGGARRSLIHYNCIVWVMAFWKATTTTITKQKLILSNSTSWRVKNRKCSLTPKKVLKLWFIIIIFFVILSYSHTLLCHATLKSTDRQETKCRGANTVVHFILGTRTTL
jgi:hypothetical protein